jgi:hypothetical protein
VASADRLDRGRTRTRRGGGVERVGAIEGPEALFEGVEEFAVLEGRQDLAVGQVVGEMFPGHGGP